MQAPGTSPLDALVDALIRSDTLRVGLRELRGGEVVYVADSKLTAEILGGTPEETAGRTARELGLPPSIVNGCKAMVARAAATGEVTTGALVVGERELACTVVPLPGSPRSLVFVEEARGAGPPLMAALVHELGNPLVAVTANIELVLRRLTAGGSPEEMIDAMSDARAAANQACDVLATMRSLAYPVEPHVTATLPAVVTAAIASVNAGLGAPDLVSAHDLPDVTVVIGRSAARQILINLIHNAVEANRRAGVVAPVAIDARVADGEVVVSITDDGPGLDAAIVPRLFAPFATARAGGTGLGLFVSRALAERIGARVNVRNREPAGTGAVAELTLAGG